MGDEDVRAVLRRSDDVRRVLRDRRERLGMSQQTLARRAEVTQSMVSGWEFETAPTLDSLLRWLAALGLSLQIVDEEGRSVLSLRQVALAAGEAIEPQEVVETVVKLAVGRYQVATGDQVVDGRTVGLLAKVLERLGWSPDELVILSNEDVDITVLHDRGLEVPPVPPYLPDAGVLTPQAVEVLATIELAENQGNTTGQCVDKAIKCHELLSAGIG